MIGRELELMELEQLIESTLLKKGSYLLLKGEKGTGKKTLVKTALNENASEENSLNLIRIKSQQSMIPFLSFDESLKNINTSVTLENIIDSKNIPKDALVITPNPEIYKKRGFNNVVWLSAAKSDSGDTFISPERIEFELTRLMKNNPDSYILFDGLEMFFPYLRDANRIKIFIDDIKKRNNYLIFASKEALGDYYADFENAITRIDPSEIDLVEHLYLFEEKNPKMSIEKHKQMVASGKNGFLITMQPRRMVQETKLENITFISESSDGDYTPSRLDFEISKRIQNFMIQNKNNGVVTITDIEGFINNKDIGFEKAYKTINYLKDMAMLNGIELIIQFNPDVFLSKEDKKTIPAFFERQFGTYKTKAYDSLNLNAISTNYGRGRAISEVLTMLETKNPALLYIENADNLDDQSKILLEHLVKHSGNGFSVIATTESDSIDYIFSNNVTELNNLSDNDSLNLIKTLLQEKNLPLDNDKINKIQTITKGNPLYISEIIEQYKREGILKTPQSLDELVSDKLAGLTEKDRTLLRRASILGRFNTKILTYMSDPKMVENVISTEGTRFSLSEEETINFLEKMEDIGFVQKLNNTEYAVEDRIKDIIVSKMDETLKKNLYSRAYLVFEDSKIPDRFGVKSQMRSLEFLSKLDYNEKIVEKLISKLMIMTSAQDIGKEVIFPSARIGVDVFNNLNQYDISLKKEDFGFALDVYKLLDNLYLSEGDIDNSIKTNQDCMEFISNHRTSGFSKKEEKIKYSLAEKLILKGDIQQAETLYKQLVYSQDKEIKFYSQINLSKINMEKNEKDIANKCIENAKKEPVRDELKQIYTTYCNGLKMANENPHLAIKEFEKNIFNNTLMHAPENSRFRNYYLINLANLQGLTGDPNSALTNLNIALEHSKNQPENEVYALVNLGILSRDQTYIERAKDKAERYGLVEKEKLTDVSNVLNGNYWFVYK